MNTAEFSDHELDVVRATLRERYGRDVDIELADSELQLDPESDALSVCPSVYWTQGDCHFVVSKTGKKRYLTRFFYSPDEVFGPGKLYYDDIFEAVVTLLKVRAGQALKRRWSF